MNDRRIFHGDTPIHPIINHPTIDHLTILGYLGEQLCFWLRSSSNLHVKLMISGATPELLRKSRAKGVSSEGKFGWAAPEQLWSGSGAAPEPSGARWSTEGGSYEPLQSSSGRLHTFHLLCSTLLHLALELLQSRSPKFAFWAHPFGSAFAEQLWGGSANHQFYM